jgi:MFS family permease
MPRPGLFGSLAVPNYRRYFVGCLSANIGQWMSMTAKSWLVLTELTNSRATVLGWLTACMFLPTVLLTPFGGMLADRVPKRLIALVTQSAFCLSATTLAVLVLSGHIELWHVFALALFDGTVGAFDGPARQSFVSELVGTDRLSNAIGLNSASFNAARLLGPGLGGLVIAAFGTGHAFAVNAASFLLLIVMLARMDRAGFHLPPPRAQAQRGGVLEGARYIVRRPQLALLFVIALMMGTFAFNYSITNPLMATAVFDQGAREYGLLGSIMGIGSLAGALLAARRPRPRLRYVGGFLALLCVTLVGTALAPSFGVFAVLMVPYGLAAVSIMVTANSMVQISIPAEVRGRVMALWGLVVMGFTPVIAPLLGWVGDTWGARATIWFGIVPLTLTLIGVTWYLVRGGLRVYWVGFHPHIRWATG